MKEIVLFEYVCRRCHKTRRTTKKYVAERERCLPCQELDDAWNDPNQFKIFGAKTI